MAFSMGGALVSYLRLALSLASSAFDALCSHCHSSISLPIACVRIVGLLVFRLAFFSKACPIRTIRFRACACVKMSQAHKAKKVSYSRYKTYEVENIPGPWLAVEMQLQGDEAESRLVVYHVWNDATQLDTPKVIISSASGMDGVTLRKPLNAMQLWARFSLMEQSCRFLQAFRRPNLQSTYFPNRVKA